MGKPSRVDQQPGDKTTKRTLIGVLLSACAASTGCTQQDFAQICDAGTFEGAFAGEELVAQNWDCRARQEFWFTDQGSQIVPYAWFLNLEQAAGTARFGDPVNLDRYRYLPQKPTPLNPDGLPIGFTKGKARADRPYGKISQDWLGMTCAACHTGQVEYRGAKYLISGGPAMADVQGLLRDLVTAMEATRDDDGKFERFAAAVIADSEARKNGGTSDRNQRRGQLEQIIAIRDVWNRRNQGASDWGHARADAVSTIFNEIAVSGPGKPDDVMPADAPVSYPFIWDTPQHDKVEWNGFAHNAGLGALVRNATEVLGVFGDLEIDVADGAVRSTSIDVAALGRLEGLVSQLQSPQWRDTGLPALDQALADRGRGVFEEYCIGCHQDINRADPDRRVKAMVFSVVNPTNPGDPNALATDITMAENFLKRVAEDPALLKNTVSGVTFNAFMEDTGVALAAVKAGQSPDAAAFIDETAARHLAGAAGPADIGAFLDAIDARFEPPDPDPEKLACFPGGILPCYKARPLNGIWATAPYLHNGSVRTLRQLLLPSACPGLDEDGNAEYEPGKCRQITFNVGSREFAPEDIGFVDDGRSLLDTTLPGNSNRGHEGRIFGTETLATDNERMEALLEYLKSL